ncbi:MULTISPECIES: hypothetical protein [unclassified Bradyrhizobium]
MPDNSLRQPSTFPERDDWLKAILSADLSHVAARVAIRIGLHLHVRTGQCNPGIAKIATGSKISERSAYRQVALLERVGWISISSGGGRKRSNHYILKYPDAVLSGFSAENPDRGDNKTLTAATKNPATKVADKKRLTANRTAVAGATTPATGERERSPSLAVIPGALVPDGGARETFEVLLTIWRRPYGESRAAAWQSFVEIYTPEIRDQLIASARRWVAARPPDKLQPLEKWLRNGAWKNQPPSRKWQGNSGKPSLFGMTLAMTRDDGDGQ